MPEATAEAGSMVMMQAAAAITLPARMSGMYPSAGAVNRREVERR